MRSINGFRSAGVAAPDGVADDLEDRKKFDEADVNRYSIAQVCTK